MAGTATKTTMRSRFGSVVRRRYVDGYRGANTVSSFGQIIKVAGCVLGLLIFIVANDALKSPGDVLLLGSIVAALFFVVGIIVAALGQLLKATLDTAVHSSPFLTDDLRAAIMSLRVDGRAEGVPEPNDTRVDTLDASLEDDASGDDRLGVTTATAAESSPYCYHCGREVAVDATTCAACGKQL